MCVDTNAEESPTYKTSKRVMRDAGARLDSIAAVRTSDITARKKNAFVVYMG